MTSGKQPKQESAMQRQLFRYRFQETVSLDDIEVEIVLALLNVESLHGPARTRLEATHYLDRDQRALIVDATTAVGEDFNRLLVGGLLREYGPDGFQVSRILNPPKQERDPCQA